MSKWVDEKSYNTMKACPSCNRIRYDDGHYLCNICRPQRRSIMAAVRTAIILTVMAMTCVHAQHRRGLFGGMFRRSQPACQQYQPMSQPVQGGFQRTPWQPPRYPMTPQGPYVRPMGPFPGPYMGQPTTNHFVPSQTVGLAGVGVLPASATNSPVVSSGGGGGCPGGVCPINRMGGG